MTVVLLMCGPPASGKSTEARRLEREEGFARLCFDEAAWARGHRHHPIREDVADLIRDELRDNLAELVADGCDVVVDSSFWSRASRDEMRAFLAPLGVEPVVVFMATPRETVLARTAIRDGSAPDAIALPRATVVQYLDHFEVPSDDEGPLRVIEGR